MNSSRAGYVYLLINMINDKKYVGQTVQAPETRWRGHIKAALVLLQQEPLYKAIRKYGVEQFSAEVIHSCEESKLDAAERRFIKLYDTLVDNRRGYNLDSGGRGGARASKTTCKKLSRVGKALWATAEHRAKMSCGLVSAQ